MTSAPEPTYGRGPVVTESRGETTVFLKPLITNPRIEVGEYTYYDDEDDPTLFETHNVLGAAGPERLVIGKFCAIASGARFVLSPVDHARATPTAFPFLIFDHAWPAQDPGGLHGTAGGGDTVIGNDVWIGRDAVITRGVTVGDGAIVAAGALVVSDVAPYTVVGGNPARRLMSRFADEDIDRLLRVAWWDWPVDAIAEHAWTIWTRTSAELEELARSAGLLH